MSAQTNSLRVTGTHIATGLPHPIGASSVLPTRGMVFQGISLETVKLPPGEAPLLRMDRHTLGFNLGASRRVEYSSGGVFRPVEIAKGAASFFPAGSSVAARWSDTSEVALVSLDPLWFEQVLQIPNQQLPLHETPVFANLRAESHIRTLLDEALEPGLAADLVIPSLATVLAIEIARSVSAQALPTGPERLTPRQVQRIKDLILSRLASPVSLPEMAAELGLSVFHFARAFRGATGVSPARYVRRERLDLAKRLLLDESTPVQEIATRLGYATPSHFTESFRKDAGVTPREFRKRERSAKNR